MSIDVLNDQKPIALNEMKKDLSYFQLFIFLMWITIVFTSSCDQRRIYEKSTLTERLITKQVMDTSIVTNHELFLPLIQAQKKAQATYFLDARIDSIYQKNYWLKEVDGQVIETPKRLDKTVLKYKSGRLVSSETYQIDGDLSLSQQYYFSHDGLLLAKHETNSALNLEEVIYQYSKEDLIFGKKHTDGKGKPVANSIITYSTTNNSSTEITDWLISETKSRVIKSYDSKGRLVKMLMYEALMNQSLHDTTEQVLEHAYDHQGKLINTKQYNTWGMTLNYKNAFYSSTDYAYDSLGNESSTTEYRPDGTLRAKFRTKYQYDDFGHWIEKTTYKNGLPESRLVRKIFYNQ